MDAFLIASNQKTKPQKKRKKKKREIWPMAELYIAEDVLLGFNCFEKK